MLKRKPSAASLWSIVLIAAVLGLAGYSQTKKAKSMRKLPVQALSFEQGMRYLVPIEKASEFHLLETSQTNFFQPDLASVDWLESALPARLNKDPAGAKIAAKLGDYRRQYVGYFENGKRTIFGNFFCTKTPVDKPLFALDGGDCYFQVWFDVENRTLINVSINGES